MSDRVIGVLLLCFLSFVLGAYVLKTVTKSYPPTATYNVDEYTFQNDGAKGIKIWCTFKIPEKGDSINRVTFDMRHGLWKKLKVVGADLYCGQDNATVSLRSEDGVVVQNPSTITLFLEDNIPGSTAVLVLRFRIRDDRLDTPTPKKIIDDVNELNHPPFSLRFKNVPPC